MSSLTSKALLNKLRNHKTKDNDGFTLIELLIVVIIVGVLSSVALPAFVGQAAKAKIASAKALASTAAKECQTYLVGDQLLPFALTTNGGGEIVFPDPAGANTCTLAAGGTFAASIPKGDDTFDTFVATVAGSSGAVTKTCTIAASGIAGETKDGCTLSTTKAGSW